MHSRFIWNVKKMDLVVFYRSNKSILFIKDLICREIFEVFSNSSYFITDYYSKFFFHIKDGGLLKTSLLYSYMWLYWVTNKQIQIRKLKILNITQKEPKFVFFAKLRIFLVKNHLAAKLKRFIGGDKKKALDRTEWGLWSMKINWSSKFRFS